MHGRQTIPGSNIPVVFCERSREGTGISSRVPLQKRSLRAVPRGIPALCDDVAAGEAWAGIPVSTGQEKRNCRTGKIPGGITSTNGTGLPGYQEVVQSMGRDFLCVRQGVNRIADRRERHRKNTSAARARFRLPGCIRARDLWDVMIQWSRCCSRLVWRCRRKGKNPPPE